MAERNERDERDERQDRSRKPEPATRNIEDHCRELLELQKVDFALVELTLYLDTHPTDMQAVQQFNQLAQRRQQIAAEFEMKHGPLLQFGHSFSRFPWQWVETPWPWQV
ncbi:spore coat protein CotJB [Cohnella endophytica]|uniref:Spore coat protein CotJB n=1 Tax=Cohnella endophytica TaxID=2419778 RepID=A0A494Y2R6_9BACL|nr:spore coat protein CotJB [Cohnella endophytica]RKP54186.1 spore coat protein CotJB [Cohnella endophytica]